MQGKSFTVDALEDLFPRRGWEINTQSAADLLQYTLQTIDTDNIQHGSRQQLLLLLKLATRSALAAYIDQAASRDWIQRLRDIHPKISAMLTGQTLFSPEDNNAPPV